MLFDDLLGHHVIVSAFSAIILQIFEWFPVRISRVMFLAA
jgi:hypothetical protein